MTSSPRPLKRAVVFSGGGARGSNEVGVLAYLREELEPSLGRELPFQIVCGTSVGAFHACFLAASAHEAKGQGRFAADFWGGLALEDMLSFGVRDVLKLGRELFRTPKPGTAWRPVGLVRPLW